MKKIIWWLILIGIIAKLIAYIITNKNYFLRRFDPAYFANLYSESQYVVGSGSKGIGDDGLYAFAGYYYFFQGGDVTKVNFEHPPLGKYLIGLSIFLFNNENVINIFYFASLLLVTYKIGQLILGQNSHIDHNILSLVAIGILSSDSLFLDHLIRSQLDLPFTLFFVTAVYFFLKGLKKKKYFFPSFLFWGAAFATRFFPFFVVIYIYLLLAVCFIDNIKGNLKFGVTRTFFIASLLVPVIYFISHTTFFIHQSSLIEFLRHKKWMLAWFTGSPVIINNIWRNIFTGNYIDPTGYSTVTNQYWTLLLPLVVTFSLFSAILNLVISWIRNSKLDSSFISWWVQNNKEYLLIFVLCIFYLIYLSFLTLGLQKMLMPIYPLLIILAINTTHCLYSIITSWRVPMRKLSKGK